MCWLGTRDATYGAPVNYTRLKRSTRGVLIGVIHSKTVGAAYSASGEILLHIYKISISYTFVISFFIIAVVTYNVMKYLLFVGIASINDSGKYLESHWFVDEHLEGSADRYMKGDHPLINTTLFL